MTGVSKIELVKKAFGIFQLYGAKSVSMDEMSYRLNVTKKTLYGYFNNKEKLLGECVKYRISQLEVFKALEDEVLDFLLACYEAYPKLCGDINHRFCYEIRKYYGGIYDRVMVYLADCAMACGKKVESGMINGYIRKDASPELVGLFLREQFFKLFCKDMEASGVDGQMSAEVILTFAYGIATRKGKMYINKKLKERMYDEAY